MKSSSSGIVVPSTVNILATASIFQFYPKGAADAIDKATATITVTVQQETATTSLTVDPNPPFYLRGNTSEISSLANGAAVYPTAQPANLPGKLTLRGNGYLSFAPVVGSSGIAFHNPGSQTTNNAFMNFTGQALSSLFDSQGEISFLLKSAYTFAERQALPAPNHRFVFEVSDGSLIHYGFTTYTSGNVLTFVYSTRGIGTIYTVPSGQEDQLFGRDKVLKVRFTWTSSSSELYLNDVLVRTSTFMPRTPNWTAGATMTIGAHTSLANPGGNYASDDAIAEFKIR